MRVEESLFDTIWVLVRINVAMVSTVVAGPFFDMVLPGTGTEKCKYESQGCVGGVCPVCPKTMIAYSCIYHVRSCNQRRESVHGQDNTIPVTIAKERKYA